MSPRRAFMPANNSNKATVGYGVVYSVLIFFVIIMWLTILYLSSQKLRSTHCIVKLTLWIFFVYYLYNNINITLISLQA